MWMLIPSKKSTFSAFVASHWLCLASSAHTLPASSGHVYEGVPELLRSPSLSGSLFSSGLAQSARDAVCVCGPADVLAHFGVFWEFQVSPGVSCSRPLPFSLGTGCTLNSHPDVFKFSLFPPLRAWEGSLEWSVWVMEDFLKCV
jgi:hypothetical protein